MGDRTSVGEILLFALKRVNVGFWHFSDIASCDGMSAAGEWMPVSKITSAVAKRGEFDWLPAAVVRKAVNAAAHRLEERGVVECRLIIDSRSHAVLEVRRR